jgi:hypothetical protein
MKAWIVSDRSWISSTAVCPWAARCILGGSPLAELRVPVTANPVADGKDGRETVLHYIAGYLTRSFLAN